jgi:hypothetical protein
MNDVHHPCQQVLLPYPIYHVLFLILLVFEFHQVLQVYNLRLVVLLFSETLHHREIFFYLLYF